jgi:hypothetical protein
MKDPIIVGERIGRLTVLSRAGSSKRQKALWLCGCDCGGHVIRVAHYLKERRGKRTACPACLGLMVREVHVTHGAYVDPAAARLYHVWEGMRQRCLNKNHAAYARYGGRGISICREWDTFISFRAWATSSGYADHLTIDRINVDGNYEPSNCQWVTKSENSKRSIAAMRRAKAGGLARK